MNRRPIVWLALCMALFASACSATPTFTLNESASAGGPSTPASDQVGTTTATGVAGENGDLPLTTQAAAQACELDDTYLIGAHDTFEGTTVGFVGSRETIDRLQQGAGPQDATSYAPSSLPVVCIEALPSDGSEITCGWEFRNAILTEVRLRPHVLRISAYPQGSQGTAHTSSDVLLFSSCPDSAETPTLFADAAPDISVSLAEWRQDTASESLGQFAEWATALASTEPLDTETCTALAVLQDQLENYFASVTTFLGIDEPWQPVAEDWYPGEDQHNALMFVVQGANSVGLRAAMDLGNGEGDIIAAGALSIAWWSFQPAPGVLEQRGGSNFGAAYRTFAGRKFDDLPSGRFQIELAASIASTRCEAEQQAAAALAAADVANPETRGVCNDLARVYDTRVQFRTAAARPAAERQPDLLSLLVPLLDVDRTLSENWTIGRNPFFDSTGLWNLYLAEGALASNLDSSKPVNPDAIRDAERFTESMHTFAREECPEIVEGIDLVSVLELVESPDEGDVVTSTADFCGRATTLLQARVAILARIDPSGAPVPWTGDLAARFDTVMNEADYLTIQLQDNEVLINPSGAYVNSGVFKGIAQQLIAMRLAHFGPVVVPMQYPLGRDQARAQDDELIFLESLCNATKTQVAEFDISAFVPSGPTYERSGYDVVADDYCPTIERALLARSGFHSQLADAAAGVPAAQLTARVYFDRLRQLGDYDLSSAMYELFPEDDALYGASRSFFGVDESMYAAALDEATEWQIEGFGDSIEARGPLLAQAPTQCPSIAAELWPQPAQDQILFDDLVEFHALPSVVDVERLCVELAKVFESRAEFRARLAANDVYDATDEIDRLADLYSGFASYDVELPEGFDTSWLNAMRRNEGQLMLRLDWGSPIEVDAVTERLPDVQLLEDYVRANCPLITAGLDLTPVLEVFGTADADDVVATQQDFCSRIEGLFEARLAFRALVPSSPRTATEADRDAYDRLLVASDDLINFANTNELLINPDGLDFRTYSIQGVVEDESLIWQGLFGPHTLPRFESSYQGDAPGTDLIAFAQQICTDLSEVVNTDAERLDALPLPTAVAEGDHEDPASQFCVRLELVRLEQIGMRSLYERAADGDERAVRDALQRQRRGYGFRDALDESIAARFPDAAESPDDDLLVFAPPRFLQSYLHNALQGDSGYSDRDRMERIVAAGRPEFEPAVRAACPDLSSEIVDLSNDYVPELYDLLRDL